MYNTKHLNTALNDFLVYSVILYHFEYKRLQNHRANATSQHGVLYDVTTVVSYKLGQLSVQIPAKL
jgi:hypothetical protein